jgi:hypothetical protein
MFRPRRLPTSVRRPRLLILAVLLGMVIPVLPVIPAQADNAAVWALINSNTNGSPTYRFSYGNVNCVGVTGDWDGNGTTTVGVVCKSGTEWKWSLINVNRSGSPSYAPFNYGNNACTPVTGDWDGNGTTTVGVVCKSGTEWKWSLINVNTNGSPSITPFNYGNNACPPVTGDWDGNRSTTVGVVCKSGTEWNWRLINVNTNGSPSITPFNYGNNACPPVTGDWDGNRSTTVGVVCKSGIEWNWRLINVNTNGSPSITPFNYGNNAWAPVTGDWNGSGNTTVGVADTTTGAGPGPSTVLWGVDSLDPITPAFLDSITATFGEPDVFARYVNRMTADEVSVAHGRNIQVLLIKQAGTSNTVGYDLGRNTANQAAGEARALGAPAGVGLFIDLEANNAIDTPYIQGWYDGVVANQFYPGYYGHTGTGSFNAAYCGAVAANGAIGGSIIWTPSPNPGRTSKAAMPPFAPNPPPCAARTEGWQYGLIGNGSPPNVDTDEFRSSIPLW